MNPFLITAAGGKTPDSVTVRGLLVFHFIPLPAELLMLFRPYPPPADGSFIITCTDNLQGIYALVDPRTEGMRYKCKLLSWLSMDADVYHFLPYVKQEYFEMALLQMVTQIIQEYWQQFKVPPTAADCDGLKNRGTKASFVFYRGRGAQFETPCTLVDAEAFEEQASIRNSLVDFLHHQQLRTAIASD